MVDVLKFGGSSLANATRIKVAVDIVTSYDQPIVVCSALGKTTDALVELGDNALTTRVDVQQLKEFHHDVAKELGVNTISIDPLFDELQELLTGISLIKELSAQTRDYLVSFGERLSVRLITAYAKQKNIQAEFQDAFDVGMITTSVSGNADLLESSAAKLHQSLNALNHTVFITGYIGKDASGRITTFGRGGSDLSASLIAAAVQANELIFYKDVDGILTCDPRVVSNAQSLKHLSFQEAAELAYFGASVLHPRSVKPARAANIPVRIKNSYNPSHPGTLLSDNPTSIRGVRAITYKQQVSLVTIESTRMFGQHGFLAKVFDIFSRHGVSVDLVATSEVSITVSVNERSLSALQQDLSSFSTVHIHHDRAVISLVGDVVDSSPILERTFTTLSKAKIPVKMVTQGASTTNISMIIDNAQVHNAIQQLHEVFFE